MKILDHRFHLYILFVYLWSLFYLLIILISYSSLLLYTFYHDTIHDLGAAEFSNPLYDTAYTAGEQPSSGYAEALGEAGVIANPTYAGLPTSASGYSEPRVGGVSGYAEPVNHAGYSEPRVGGSSGYAEPADHHAGYSEPAHHRTGYAEPEFMDSKSSFGGKTGEYMDADDLGNDSSL